MNPSPRMSYEYIETSRALDALTERISGASRIALDIEGNSLYRYHQRVCLIQLAIEGEVYLVDPLSDVELSRFLEELAKKTLLFHAGDYDLRMLRASMGFEPVGEVLDTMLAAQLLGREQLGLVALVEQCLGVQLSKSGKHGQKSNWARRPLSPAQLRYAGDDVRYLDALTERLDGELRALGRLEWHRESCARMVQATKLPAEPNGREPWRIKGISMLNPREAAFVRELWHWRENEARDADRPPFKIMGNQQIVELAVWAAGRGEASLEDAPQIPVHYKGARLEALYDALRRAQELDEPDWPEPRLCSSNGPPSAEHSSLVDALREECAGVAAELGISPSVLASRSTMTAVARVRPKALEALAGVEQMMRWQVDVLGPRILEVLGRHEKKKR